LEIYSENLHEGCDLDTKVFSESAAEILGSLVGSEGEASIVFVSDERIRELNRTYRGADRATDVLTFSLRGDSLSRGVLGDVYISLETAARRAKRRGVPLEEEVLRLLVHGLLHLAGHTHDGREDGVRMRKLERELLAEHKDRVRRRRRRTSRPAGNRKRKERNGRRA
jgi:probable rRNA maturation factor